MANFDTIGQIERAIAKGLSELQSDEYFLNRLKIQLRRAVYDKVYAIPAGGYIRRYDAGGLGDKRNMVSTTEKGGRKSSEIVEDDEGFIVPSSGSEIDWLIGLAEHNMGAGEAITIEIKDDAPPSRPAPWDLDYMVEEGKGRGNMASPRPFYATADDYVTEDADVLSDIATMVINRFL